MSNFLARLVERQWGRIATVEPRTQSIFAPVADAPSFQVGDAAALQPHADWRQEPDKHHAAPEAERRDPDPVQQQSRERWVSPSEPLVRQTIAPPMVRPLLGSTAPAEATTDVERQTPPSRWSAPPMPIHPVLDASVGVQPVPKQGQAATSKDTAGAHSFTETTLIPAPPLVGPRAQDPMPARQQVSAPASLLVAEPETERSRRAEPRAIEPPVHVTIGRIEVTAVTTPPAPKRVASPRKASMPLQDYLARRRGGQS